MTGPLRALVTRWFSFLHGEVTAGDALAAEAVQRTLDERFARCRRIAVGVSVVDPADPAVRRFDEVLPRDAPGRPAAAVDLSLSVAASGTLPLVGVVLTGGGTVSAADRAEVAARGEYAHGGVVGADRLRGAVKGAVVHDDDRWPFGEAGQPVEGVGQAVPPVAGDDHDADPGCGPRRHERAFGRPVAERAARRASAVVERPSR